MLVEFSRILVPPVRLPERDALAQEACRAPLFDRAARLAAHLGHGAPVGPGGTLPGTAARAAAEAIGADLDTPAGAERLATAWDFGVAAGLIALTAPDRHAADALAVPGDVFGVPSDSLAVPSDSLAVPSDALAVPGDVFGRSPALTADEVPAVWRAGLAALAEAAPTATVPTG